MCNLNNDDTLEESLRSVADQLDDRFEIIIVDDGSTDGSLETLNKLEAENSQLRVVDGSNNNLAEARNQSFREAEGDYILESMDLDDKYSEGILDFVEVFEQIDSQIDDQIYLKGKSINIASRDLLLRYPYRSLGYGEDRDLWRRLFANDNIIWLDHEPFYEVMREDYRLREHIRNVFNIIVVDFRSGISFWSFLSYSLRNIRREPRTNLFRLCASLFAFLIAISRGRYTGLSEEYRQMGALDQSISNQSVSLAELEEQRGITIDRSRLSNRGEDLFYDGNYLSE